jgi:hypothetical protein
MFEVLGQRNRNTKHAGEDRCRPHIRALFSSLGYVDDRSSEESFMRIFGRHRIMTLSAIIVAWTTLAVRTQLSVKFRADRAVRLREGAAIAREGADTDAIQAVLAKYPGVTISRTSPQSEQAVDAERIQRRSAMAVRDSERGDDRDRADGPGHGERGDGRIHCGQWGAGHRVGREDRGGHGSADRTTDRAKPPSEPSWRHAWTARTPPCEPNRSPR